MYVCIYIYIWYDRVIRSCVPGDVLSALSAECPVLRTLPRGAVCEVASGNMKRGAVMIFLRFRV